MLARPRGLVLACGAVVLLAGTLLPFLGQDFFPIVDAGQIRLHIHAPLGLRVEETARLVARVAESVRRIIPALEIGAIFDNNGISSTLNSNLAYSDNPTTGVTDAGILVVLDDSHGPVDAYRREIRAMLRCDFPDVTYFFQAADNVGQILNFGLPAPINGQVVDRDRTKTFAIAKSLERRFQQIPGAVDVYLHQRLTTPELFFAIDPRASLSPSASSRVIC